MTLKQNQSGVAHLAAIVIVILVAGLGFAGWRVYDLQNKNDILSKNTSQPEVKTETAKVPEGYVEYKNNELGISFAYPKEWGQATFGESNCDDSEAGRAGACGGYSASISFLVNGESSPTAVDISLSADDAFQSKDGGSMFRKGYQIKNGKVYAIDTTVTLDDARIVKNSGTEYVYVNAKEEAAFRESKTPYFYGGINLVKSSRYKGASISTVYSEKAYFTEQTFLKFMDTFRVFK